MSCETYRSNFDKLRESLKEGEDIFAQNSLSYVDIVRDFATDIKIICPDIILPSHRYILSLRCKAMALKLSSGETELDWTAYESNTGIALLRWFYTDEIESDDNNVILGLLRASHHFGLPTLFESCEQKLLSSNIDKCPFHFYATAIEVNSRRLIEKCLKCGSLEDDRSTAGSDRDDKARTLPCCTQNMGLDRLDAAFRHEVQELMKRKDKLDENCMKLNRSLMGVREYMKFFDKTIWGWPAHAYILYRRSEAFRDVPSYVSSGLGKLMEFYILRWLYTDVVYLDDVDVTLSLLQAAVKFKLDPLFDRCEEALMQTVSVSSCAGVHGVALTTESMKLVDCCERIASKYLDVIMSEVPWNAPSEASVEVDGSSPLLSLNDDCLLHLFRFVSLPDLASVKDTCRRLNQLVEQSYRLRRDKSIAIRQQSFLADILTLKHFGKLADSLQVVDIYPKYCAWPEVFEMIARYTNQHLKSFSIQYNFDGGFTHTNLMLLKSILRNVEIIKVIDFNDSEKVETLLGFCERLSEVHVYCDELELDTHWCFNNRNIKSVTLKELISDNVLKGVCENFVHLESLTVNVAEFNANLSQICRLEHLQHLKLECFDEDLNDAVPPVLKSLAEKDRLKSLHVACNFLCAATALAVCEFATLDDLVLECSEFDDNVSNILALQLKNVENISFLNFLHITIEDITGIVKNRLNLKTLTISGCDSIELIDRKSYVRLRKRRNLSIYLDKSVYDKTKKLLANDLSDYVKIMVVSQNRFNEF